jgi:hypothetical protein
MFSQSAIFLASLVGSRFNFLATYDGKLSFSLLKKTTYPLTPKNKASWIIKVTIFYLVLLPKFKYIFLYQAFFLYFKITTKQIL